LEVFPKKSEQSKHNLLVRNAGMHMLNRYVLLPLMEASMSENIQRTITELQQHLNDLEADAIDTKRTINSLCRRINQPPIYPDAQLERSQGITTPVRGDEYYGKPLATVVRWVLEARQAANLGPATINELYDAMAKGGYLFDAKSEDNAKRGLRISLAKNTTTFHRLPTGKFGLTEWYPTIKERPEPNGGKKQAVPSIDGEQSEDEFPLNGVSADISTDSDVERELPVKPK
jgi:hypothetical protein